MDISNLNILVTGGAGFIGSHIVEYLIKKNVKKLRIIDNLSTGHLDNIDFIKQYNNVEFILGDISNIDICRTAVKDIDVICHQAALGSVPRSINNPFDSHNTNVNGFFNILLAAKEHNIKRVVYASSSSVYGDNKFIPKKEDTTGELLSPYAVTKYIDELYAKNFTKVYGMECIGLRYFNVFGPRQDSNSCYAAVIPNFIKKMLVNETPIIYGDGTNSRDFTFVSNVIDANIQALTTKNPLCYGKVFNIGCGSNVTINKLFQIIKNTLNFDGEPLYKEKRIGDIEHSQASLEKSNNYLDYHPSIEFETGIKLTINYYENIFKNKNM